MRLSWLWLGGAAFLVPAAASAAEQLKFGPAPAWVSAQSIPPASAKNTDRPIAILLHDQQVRFDPKSMTNYSELAFKIQKPEGLAAGNLSIAWDPATDTATVNKLEIHRDGQTIDVLKSGQTFTTLRRESNLELAMLDGQLTANIQPEGLREGDIVVLATTTERLDPVLKGHVEATFAPWGEAQIGLAHARILWPSNLQLTVKKSGDLPPPKEQRSAEGLNVYELTMRNAEPVIAPKGAPLRFKIGRIGEATDFRTWADAAMLFVPLYADAARIPASGSLREEVEKIRKASSDQKTRGQLALQLVQERVRYVALLMGQGGLAPAPAETTWSRRFGDCKGKTALMLGILHELGIKAEPVLANLAIGDAIGERLPMLGLFNHVLVRAHVGDKSYWLDGTRSGDTSLDSIAVSDFGWVLPLVDNSQLVHLVPPPLDHPDSNTMIAIDASKGVYVPATVTADQTIRGDLAVGLNSALASLSDAQRKEYFDIYWKKSVADVAPEASSFTFDKGTRQLHLTMQGKLKLDWTDGFFRLPNSSVGYDPDLDRREGTNHDAPFAVDHPEFARTMTRVRFPAEFFPKNVGKLVPESVHATLIGVQYSRIQSASPNEMSVETETRSLVPEVAYKDAVAARAHLKALAEGDVSARLPRTYHATSADLSALKNDTPGSAAGFITRGNTFMDNQQFGDSIADFTKALELQPENVFALSNRALAYVWTNKFNPAQADIDRAKAIDGKNAVLLRARALLAERRGQFSEAIELYTKSLVAEPDNRFALLHRGDVRAAQGDADGALADYESASASLPDQESNHLYRAIAEAQIGRLDDAKKSLAAAETSNPKAPGLSAARGLIAEKNGDFRAAVEAYTDGLRMEPSNANMLMRRAASYGALDDKTKALADSDAALKAGYKGADLRLLRANIYYRLGNRDATAREAQLATSEHPDSEYAFVLAGKTYARLDMRKEALKAFDRAIELNPAPYVYVNRAEVRPITYIEGRLADYDAALKLEPNYSDALLGKATLLTEQGKTTEAAALYGRVIEVLPKNPRNASERAVLLYKAGRTAEAEKAFADARTRARSATELNSLCWGKATAGFMLQSALQDCQDALNLSPNNPSYLDSLAMVLLKLGKLDEALAVYDKAIAGNAGPSSLMGRAIVRARKGDRIRAQADAAAATKQWPESQAVFARDYNLRFELP